MRLVKVSISGLIGLFLSLCTPFAQGQVRPEIRNFLTCEELLRDFQVRANGGETLGDDFSELAEETEPTLEVIASLPGRHGGTLSLLRKTGSHWGSTYKTVGFDPQGDPRWFLDIVGADAGTFFGFKILGPNSMTVPDATEFNGALAAVNGILQEKINVTFYATPTNANSSVADYTRHFGNDAALPLAPGGNHRLHDLSFHTGAIFLPPEIIRLKSFTVKIINDFFAFLDAKYALNPERLRAVRTYAYIVRHSLTLAIDSGTGLLNPAIVMHLHQERGDERLSYLNMAVNLMVNSGKSVHDHLLMNLTRRGLDASLKLAPERLLQAKKALSLATLLQDLAKFEKGRELPPEWSVAVYATPSEREDICRRITERRFAIRAAALKLLSPP